MQQLVDRSVHAFARDGSDVLHRVADDNGCEAQGADHLGPLYAKTGWPQRSHVQ
jgi:hypothetical protein